MTGPLASLIEVSARIGAEPLLVQGPGGNTSLKLGDVLWVKASGSWLAEAASRQIFMPLSLSGVRQTLGQAMGDDVSGNVLSEAEPGLRPSIETAFHALMPHPVVIHAHAVNAMATSVLADGEARTRAALGDEINWAWVEYQRPGAPLAAAVARALSKSEPDVLLLQNHGVIVGGSTPALAETLLREVERRLSLPPRDLAKAFAPHQSEDYEALPAMSGLALDTELTAILSAAPLFPDQVVFVGGAVPVVGEGSTLADVVEHTRQASGVTPVLVLAPGVGAYGMVGRTKSADSIIQGLFELARRIPAGATVVGLPHEAVPELLGWDAEKYRLGLAGDGPA